jgi:hypothetical protein
MILTFQTVLSVSTSDGTTRPIRNPKTRGRVSSARRWCLFRTTGIQPVFFLSVSLRFVPIFTSHLHLDLLKSLFPSKFPIKMLYAFLVSFICPIYPVRQILLDCLNILLRVVLQIMNHPVI